MKLKKRSAIIILMLCLITSGCSVHLLKWSADEVAWFACCVLFLTGWLLQRANRITLQLAGAPSTGVGPVLSLGGLFFLVWGAKLNLIRDFGSSIPLWDQWGFEGLLYPKVLEGDLNPLSLFSCWNEHRLFFTRLLHITILKMNGQWDPIVTVVVAALLYSLILTSLCLVLWRVAGRRNLPLFCIIIAVIGVSHFSWESTLGGMHSCFYFLLGFSLLAIVFLIYSEPFSVSWCLGLIATLMGQFSLGSGFLAPLAVAGVLFLNRISRVKNPPCPPLEKGGLEFGRTSLESGGDHLKESSAAIVALLAVAVLEYLLVPFSHETLFENISHVSLLGIFGRAAAWPFRAWPFAVVVWLPFLMLIREQFRTKRTSPLAQFVLALGTWSILQSTVLAGYRGGAGSRHADLQAVGLLVNLVIAFYIFASHAPLPRFSGSYKKALWLGIALLVYSTANSALHLKERATLVEKHLHSGIQVENTAKYILTGDPSSLRNKPEFEIPASSANADGLLAILDNKTLRNVLPTCIRAPLPLEPAENSGFRAGGTPPWLPPLSYRRVLGSWNSDKKLPKSEYLSEPISSSLQWLVFDLAGGGPGISFEIIPSEGPVIRIYDGKNSSGWEEIVVNAPRSPFRLHVADCSEHGWVAFSLPRELAGGGYLIRKILSGNLFVIMLGIVSLLAGVIIVSREDMRSNDPENPIFSQNS